MPYDINAMRKKLIQQSSGRVVDPDEFRPKKNESTTEPIKYRFYILPPLMQGDELKSGTVTKTMDMFYIKHGSHWIDSKPYPCPRVAGSPDKCPICQCGFDLMKEEKDEDARRKIRTDWMPSENYLVNVFFTNWKNNPEELRGKVKFFNATATCFKMWSQALERVDSGGDSDEPEAFGAFFDENNASLFELSVLKQGNYNSYITSSFRKEKPGPMIIGEDGKASAKGLATLLKCRINLWDKIQVPDVGVLKAQLNKMLHGDDTTPTSSSVDTGFDVDEIESKSSQKQTSAPKPKQENISKPNSSSASESEIDNLLGQLNSDD